MFGMRHFGSHCEDRHGAGRHGGWRHHRHGFGGGRHGRGGDAGGGDMMRAGRMLAVSHMFRFYPVRARMHEIVSTHGLGAIRRVQIHEGAPYAWETRSGYTFRRGEVSGGVVANAGIHSLDSLIQWFVSLCPSCGEILHEIPPETEVRR